MKAQTKQTNFWVIEGVKVKRKQPFIVQEVDRTLTPQIDSQDSQEQKAKMFEEIFDGGNFFTENSYEQLDNRRREFGDLNCSPILKSQLIEFGTHPESSMNRWQSSPPDWLRVDRKPSLFMNEFIPFYYRGFDEEQKIESKLFL